MLNTENYKIGNEINKKITGKGISIQSWNISKKIKEVNDFKLSKESNKMNLFESHPELCFESLNKNPLMHSKKTDEGVLERLDIINKYILLSPNKIDEFYRKFKSNFKKR